MLIDTHCHLNFKAFKDDWPEVIERAFKNNIGLINVGSQLSTSQRAIKIASGYKEKVYAAIGLHPIHVPEEDFDREIYKKIAQNSKVVALGETGLDYYHLEGSSEDIKEQKQLQAEVFRQHLDLSKELNLPVIIHCREAYGDLLKTLREFKKKSNFLKGVIHCFSADKKIAQKFLDLGFLISFTGIITFTKEPKDLEVVVEVPLNRIMVETDAPYLAPIPYRGKRNEPAYVYYVAEKIAEIKNVSLREVSQVTTENAQKLFNLK